MAGEASGGGMGQPIRGDDLGSVELEEVAPAELGIEELESRLQTIGAQAIPIDIEIVVSVSW